MGLGRNGLGYLGYFTISMGIAAFPEDGNSNTTLVNYADKALYDAKRQGKNRICG